MLMCGFGWLVPAISWAAVFWVVLYCLIWVFILSAIRIVTEKLISHRAAYRADTAAMVTQSLRG